MASSSRIKENHGVNRESLMEMQLHGGSIALFCTISVENGICALFSHQIHCKNHELTYANACIFSLFAIKRGLVPIPVRPSPQLSSDGTAPPTRLVAFKAFLLKLLFML